MKLLSRHARRRLAELRALPRTPRHLRPVMIADGLTSQAEAGLLYGLARDAPEGAVVEVGSYRGRSTVALARGARAGRGQAVFAIEPHEAFLQHVGAREFGPEDRAAFYRTMLRTRSYRDVRLVNLSSERVAPGWDRPVALLFLDGDHSPEGVRRDLHAWWPHVVDGAAVAFDDAVDPQGGPAVVIDEEIAAGRLEPDRSVGKVRVLTARKAGGG